MFQLHRVYDRTKPAAGFRVLVDRLWPRGVSRQAAHIDLWLKEAGPSDALRKWFGHDPIRWAEFQRRYRKELRAKPAIVSQLRELEKQHGTVTLVYSARDEEHNQAVALRAYLQGRK